MPGAGSSQSPERVTRRAALESASMRPSPTLRFYTRASCSLCREARLTLQEVLEERVAGGRPVPAVREVDIDLDQDAQARYLDTIPVLRLGEEELRSAAGHRTIGRFIDSAMARVLV